ncbi:MAG: leucine--tRNA ligase [Candidatus Cloacimonetes bacterium]|nr:leucine--tRNA ligase [Candidatus Cloacimonadota bacterium]
MEYPFDIIEKKWQSIWQEKKIFQAVDLSEKTKYYVLSMFPYPSGTLHMGHVSNYSIADAISRFKLMDGYNVMQPMGYDSFGMPAENYAIRHRTHPRLSTDDSIKVMKKQFKMMGFGIDWTREVSTCHPEYYRWGQWLFKRMYEKGLVYRKSSYVNWCNSCKTVLANEQVEEGRCWRCEEPVRQKELEQWFFRITEYAEELLDFSSVINWPERVKIMQTNWIGKSKGTNIHFHLSGSDEIITVFTTRPDTIFGCTFMALPPEHPLVASWLKGQDDNSPIVRFCNKVINEDKIKRTAEETTKEGIFSGHFAINPVNGEKVQIWITNYVLMEYGTGAVMAVPAHDQRDFEFARKYGIPIKIVIQTPAQNLKLEAMTSAYTDPGILVNSEQFNGMKSEESKASITHWMEDNGTGEEAITYRLRDWGISRQRYWGTPIPVIYCQRCGVVLVPDDELPVKLPEQLELGNTTTNPLLSAAEWINTPCPNCGGPARRETDTMDTFVDSSWYFARYTDAQNEKGPFTRKKADYWLPVDQYIGGIEHACMHLLYARFFHKFMRDIGLIGSNEPFARLLTQGMVTKDGAKMSKSKGNVVDPQYILDRFGADTVRVFMLFASPPEKDIEWSDEGVKGAFRFLNRLWRLFAEKIDILQGTENVVVSGSVSDEELDKLRYSTHFTVKKVLDDIERMQYNTAIAAIMEHLNNIYACKNKKLHDVTEKNIFIQSCRVVPQLLYPFAPHLSEELWSLLGYKQLIHNYGIPTYSPEFLEKELVNYVIQIMGRIRGKLEIAADASPAEIEREALSLANVQKHINGKKVKKVIIIPKKLISIVL